MVGAGEVGELGEGAHAGEVVLGAAPDREGGAPVAVAGERPVDVVVQPVAEAAVLDRLREPVGALVLAQQGVLDRGGADVPGRLGVVEQGGVAAPAVRVAVLVGDVLEEQAAGVEVGDEVLVGLLEELAADEGQTLLEGAVGAHRVDDRQAVAAAGLEVVLTEGRGLVDQARTVVGGDVLGVDDEVGALQLDQVEGAAVGPALHVAAGEGPAGGLPALAEGLFEEGLGDDQVFLAVGGHDVGDVRVGGDRRVGDQGPGGGRPDEEGRLAGERARGEGEADEDRGVDDGFVAWASSWSDRPVPQRGHQGATRWSWTSRPLSKTCLRDHQTDWM